MFKSWTAEEVAQQLESIQLGKYAPAFIAQEINGDTLTGLTNDDCRELGLTIGARIRLNQWVQSLISIDCGEQCNNEDEAPIAPAVLAIRRRNEVEAVPEDSGVRSQCRFCRRYFHPRALIRHRHWCPHRPEAPKRAPFLMHQCPSQTQSKRWGTAAQDAVKCHFRKQPEHWCRRVHPPNDED
jgi:hypothetical protein